MSDCKSEIMNKDELFTRIKDILVNDFDIEEEKIKPETLLVDELDLDSVDFIDLVSKTKDFIPGRIGPEVFNSVKKVQDVIDNLYPYIKNN